MRRLVSNPSEFHMLQASAVVRQFLIDDRPLLPMMNRITRLGVSFQTRAVGMVEWSKSITGEYPNIFSTGHSIGPSNTTNNITFLSLDKFLSLEILVLFGDIYKVYDVITYCANAAGGVHHTAKGERLKSMLEKPQMLVMGVSIIPQLMAGICDSVDWACKQHEIFLLHMIGHEALAGGLPHEAISFFEETINAARGSENERPDLWNLFHESLEKAKTSAQSVSSSD